MEPPLPPAPSYLGHIHTILDPVGMGAMIPSHDMSQGAIERERWAREYWAYMRQIIREEIDEALKSD